MNSYAQAGFEMKEVFLHIKMLEQALIDDHPAILIQEISSNEIHGSMFKLTFACNSSISWPVMSGALDTASICCKKIQIFEKKGSTLGVVNLLVQAGHEKTFKARIETALRSAAKRPKPGGTTMKFAFGLCGCQDENGTAREEAPETDEDSGSGENSGHNKAQLSMPLPSSKLVVSVDEWQTVQSSSGGGGDGDEIGKWLLNSDHLEFSDQCGPNSFRGVYKGKRVGIERLRGCEKGSSYEFELRRDLLELMTCGHKNILQFHGVCVDENHGLCVVTKLMEGGSVYDLVVVKGKRIQTKEVVRIAGDVAQGIKFMNDHGVAYRDLNSQKILLDKNGNACLGDMGIVSVCNSVGEAMEYETDGYRWLAPEVC